jgi:osmoprotectant transport system permease protein
MFRAVSVYKQHPFTFPWPPSKGEFVPKIAKVDAKTNLRDRIPENCSFRRQVCSQTEFGNKKNKPFSYVKFSFLIISFVLFSGFCATAQEKVIIGGKNFNENFILAEMMAQLLEAEGFEVERKLGLGGTLVCFSALENGEIDAYPEYSGTIEQAVLKLPGRAPYDSIGAILIEKYNLELLKPFGFNNTYTIAMNRKTAAARGIRTISDLGSCLDCKLGFSLEFLNRQDGWIGLKDAYGLPQKPSGMEHGLSYIAIQNGEIDATDAYSTDGDIPKYDLVLLEDDKHFFPVYLGAPLVRLDFPKRGKAILQRLAGTLDDKKMQALNAQVIVEGKTFAEAAAVFLLENGLIRDADVHTEGFWARLQRRAIRHIFLTVIALAAAILIAVPLGVFIYRVEKIGRLVLYFTGLLQTIPSIALLALMIPLFGIGIVPAIVALYLYALLPVLRNTATALFNVDPVLKKVSVGMGMTHWQQLKYIELPLAVPTILAGVRTSAVITIGTATLAAFIGAGGLGEPIFTGLFLNDARLIMEGAIPAALLAIFVELLFELIERLLIPAHLLQKSSS